MKEKKYRAWDKIREELIGYGSLPLRKLKEMEIIGNIWENPELLE